MSDLTPLLGLDIGNTRHAFTRLDVMGSLIGTFAPDGDLIDEDRTTRRFYYRGARYFDEDQSFQFVPDGFIVCPDDQISFVMFDPYEGVTVESALDPNKFIIAEVTCASGSLTHLEDLRDMKLISRLSQATTFPVYDDVGVVVGNATALRFTGAGSALSADGDTAVIDVPGAGSPQTHRNAFVRPGGFTTAGVSPLHQFGIVYTEAGNTAPGAFTTASGTLGRMPRRNLQIAADNQDIGWKDGGSDQANIFWRGNASGQGGFRARGQFGWDFGTITQMRGFAGVKVGVLTIGSNNIDTLVNLIGFGFEVGDTTWQLVHNDGSGTATVVDTGVDIDNLEIYEVEVFCTPNASSMYVALYLVNERGERTALLYDATVSTDLPSNSAAMGFQNISNRAASGSGTITAALVHVEVTGA